jgi:hypothetical protein
MGNKFVDTGRQGLGDFAGGGLLAFDANLDAGCRFASDETGGRRCCLAPVAAVIRTCRPT